MISQSLRFQSVASQKHEKALNHKQLSIQEANPQILQPDIYTSGSSESFIYLIGFALVMTVFYKVVSK